MVNTNEGCVVPSNPPAATPTSVLPPLTVLMAPSAVSASDVDVLDNALGYVLNQEGTAHFSPDNFKAYAFKLDYAVVTFPSALDGVDAKAFFEHLGTIDAALFSGQFAGFTQIAFQVHRAGRRLLSAQEDFEGFRFVLLRADPADNEDRAVRCRPLHVGRHLGGVIV